MSRRRSGRGGSLFIRGLLVMWGSLWETLVTPLPPSDRWGVPVNQVLHQASSKEAKNTNIYVVQHDVPTSTGILGRFSIDRGKKKKITRSSLRLSFSLFFSPEFTKIDLF